MTELEAIRHEQSVLKAVIEMAEQWLRDQQLLPLETGNETLPEGNSVQSGPRIGANRVAIGSGVRGLVGQDDMGGID